MLVCHVSQRARRVAIAADIAETATAVDVLSTTNIDVAAAETASAGDTVSAGFLYSVDAAETATATDSPNATITPAAATTWNPSDKAANIALSNANLTMTSTGGTAAGVRSTTSRSGKYYCEITMTGASFSLQGGTGCGIVNGAAALTSLVSNAGAMISVQDGQVYVGTTVSSVNFGGLAPGNVVCLAVDMTNNRVWFRINGGNWNNSGTANPATNTGGLDISSQFVGVPAFAVAASQSSNGTATANFGATAFAQTIPSGFTAWT